MIEVRGLTKAYGRKQVLHDVSFTAPPGAVTGFLGPNGAGKTTSLRLMLGLELGEGSTRFEGRRLTDWPVPATVVGAVVDANSFHPTVPIRRQLSALAAASGLDVRTRPDAVLESMGLADVARMAPRKLSLGMRQRLGLAAAILGDPRILVLDEPSISVASWACSSILRGSLPRRKPRSRCTLPVWTAAHRPPTLPWKAMVQQTTQNRSAR